MTVKKLTIKNVGMISDTAIEFNKPLMLFYGDLCQGKTTILNAVKYAFGGSYPSDIIRHGQQEASVTLEFDNGSITREWYRSKDGLKTSDRPIVFILDGKSVKRPVDEIKKFLNPYLLDNEYLKRMTETERKAYFGQLFAVDTSDLDKEQAVIESEGRDLRVTIKAYGVIDTTEVKLLDTAAAEAELAKVKADILSARNMHGAEVQRIQAEYLKQSLALKDKNSSIETLNKAIDKEIESLNANKVELQRLQGEIKTQEEWLEKNTKGKLFPDPPPVVIPDPPTMPDTSELEATIRQGEANKVLYEAYQDRLIRAAKKKAYEKRLTDIEAKWRELKKQKIARLKEIDTGGIENLSFDENGNFIYEGTQASMLSTSQIMRLSGELSSLYPQGFGLELIDRAESLGKSIFGFIERAKREEKSILATIVGEKPAEVSENVGVWIVEGGEVK